jgi:hypothetical protein
MGYQKLDPQFKAYWVWQLRYGGYKQGKNCLKAQHGRQQSPRFCCLGVACDLGTKGNWKKPKGSTKWEYEGWDKSMPSDATLKAMGLEQEAAEFLAGKNDAGWSFKKIATWIEKNL